VYWAKKKTDHNSTQGGIEECISAFIFVKENGHFASMIRALACFLVGENTEKNKGLSCCENKQELEFGETREMR
jgi:hypothetical protein